VQHSFYSAFLGRSRDRQRARSLIIPRAERSGSRQRSWMRIRQAASAFSRETRDGWPVTGSATRWKSDSVKRQRELSELNAFRLGSALSGATPPMPFSRRVCNPPCKPLTSLAHRARPQKQIRAAKCNARRHRLHHGRRAIVEEENEREGRGEEERTQ